MHDEVYWLHYILMRIDLVGGSFQRQGPVVPRKQ